MTDEYNGWANRETWALQLHLTNEQTTYEHMRDVAKDIVEEEHTPGTMAFTSTIGAMASYIEDWTDSLYESVLEDGNISEPARMLVSDVGSSWRVDFHEIAKHWVDEAKEELAS